MEEEDFVHYEMIMVVFEREKAESGAKTFKLKFQQLGVGAAAQG